MNSRLAFLKKNYWIEIPVFYFVLFALERSVFRDFPGFSGVSPHPYWLGVLLFSCRYGLEAGTSSGIFGAGLYLTNVWVWGDRYLFEDASFYLLPSFFILTGVTLGSIINRFRQGLKQKDQAIARIKEKHESLLKELDVQQKINQTLEKQTVSQMASVVTLYQGATKLGNLEPSALYQGILDFFTQALQAKKAAVYLKKEGVWKMEYQKGWDESDSYAKSIDPQEGLIGKAAVENRVVSLRDWFGSDLSRAWEGRKKLDSIIAGPLRKGPNNVVGVYAIQDVPFLKFNSANLNLLTLLLDWGEAAIAKSVYFEELKSKAILDEVLDVYNEQYFHSRTHQEFSRSQTYSLPFSILMVSVSGVDSLDGQAQINFYRALSRLLKEESREIDIVTKTKDPRVPFAVLMMTASKSQADQLKKKMVQAYAKLNLEEMFSNGKKAKFEMKIGVGSYKPEIKTVEELIGQAKKGL